MSEILAGTHDGAPTEALVNLYRRWAKGGAGLLIIRRFAVAARVAKLAGFMRFLLEIVRAIRAEVGPSFPIAVKLNSADFQRGGFGEEESMDVVRALEKEGIDLLEISGGNYESPAMMNGEKKRASTEAREAFFLEYAENVRKLTTIPLLLTGGMRTAATMENVIASGAVDMVGIGPRRRSSRRHEPSTRRTS